MNLHLNGGLAMNWMVRLSATLLLAVLDFAATAAAIPLEVAKPIQSHMVLQRGRDVCRVWGRATPGSEVTVTFANGGRTIVAKGTAAATGDTVGLWEANLGRLVASDNPETLAVTCGVESLTVEDVLVGDVWLNLGQSNASMNMGWPTVNWGGEKEPAPNGDKIRSTAIYCGSSNTRSDYAFPTAAYAYACDWGRATDAATYKFIPAMGYHFARRLVRETGVPVGVLGVSSGGLSCSAYAPGGAVWNASYYPLRRYAVSGVLWYQGENGTTAKDQKNLVDGLREAWGYSPDEMPFYCVEVNFCGTAVVYPNADGVAEMSAKSKTDALYAVPTSAILQGGWRDYCDRVELVSCRDFADPRSEWDAYFMPAGMGLSCHNRVKKLVGERLALYALRDVYQPAGEYWTGHTVTAGGPRFETATAEANGRVRVTFKAGTTGLGLTAGGKTLRLGESPAFTGGDMGTSLPKDLLEVPYDNDEPVTTDEPIRGWALGEANGATTNWAWAVATVDKGGELVLWARGIRRPNVVFYGFVPNPARFFNCYAKTTQRRDGKDVTVLLPAELTVPQAVTGVSAATERTSFQAVSLAACTVEPISTQYVHANGALPRPHPVVTAPDGTLVSEGAFSCVYTYADGKGTVTLTGDGKDVTGTRTVVFDVKAFDFADALIRNIANVNYTGDPVEPKFTFFGFVYPQTVLGITHEDCIVPTAGVDYTYELSNNVNPGVATLVLRGNGTATRGALTRTFKIVGNLKTATAITVDPIADQSFTGVAITPSVTLRLKDGTALKEGTDYTLAYANNTAVGKATVTVTGKGNYAGARTANFNIVSGEVTNYLVTFKDWDGATLKSDYVAKGASATAPPDPSRVGYRFTGWLPADFSSVTDNLTVVAQYVEDGTVVQTWRVVWQNWDGTVLKEEDVEDGHDATAPGDPTKPNATFNGWSSSGKNITSDMVIVAQFIGGAAKTYTITFVDGWGTTLSTQEVEEGKSAVKPENPTHEGYVFTGWDTVEWEYAAADTVVTAQWRKDEGGEDPTGHEDDNPGEIVLSPLYQDHMVLQRDQAITVWGKNAAGRKVTVSFGGKTATAMTGADGSWTATFDSAFVVETTGRTMTVTDDAGHKVTVLDVVVGDVYLATGQSNMDLRLVAVGDYVFTNGTERGDAFLRYRRMPRGVSRANPLAFDTLEPTDENRARNWTLTTDETARNAMSACAYYFGMKLREEVPGVPIGVVVASMGATIITWHMTPETVAAEKAAGRVYNADASKCWNAMLNPIRKGSFRGAIWYQGESDGGVGTEDYLLRLQALVQGWRDVWGSDFAFYCVQLHVVTTYKHDDGTVAAPDLAGNACQREAQRRWFMDDTGRKGLAVICATSTVDTHAKDKQFVGERLARFALKDFNGSTANACGPLFKSATDAGSGRVRVTFEAGTAKGLSAGSRTGESAKKPNQPVVLDPAAAIKGFALSENGKDWVFADTVTVDGETLLVSATGLGAPAYIHYGSWNNPYARGINLFNADKLECSPFAPVQVSGGDTPTHAHAWGDWTTNAVPTCVTDGSMSRTCAAEGCAIGTETKKLDRLGHAWGEWIVTKPAEVGVKGEETRLCSRCELAETREIAPLPRPEDRHPMANAESGYYMEVEINGVTNRVEVFTNATQAISWTVPADVTKLDYLVVGGGGGGGYQYGGGGGGGGVLEGTASVVPGATLSVTVGAGGAGGASASTPGANGSASALANGEVEFARAPGGGGGAYLRSAGLAGANGGGGSKGAGGKTTMAGGFAGGGSTGVDGGSGGGGAGGVGGVNNKKTDQTGVCGAGGPGVESTITGTAVRYAGGGGGGGAENGSGATYYAAGGLGTDGGGNGGTRLVEDGVYVTGVAATPGTDGLGGGGGGGAHGSNKARMAGAKGGDGVVILRYALAGGELPVEPQPTVDGKTVEIAKVFDAANSAKPIVYPSAPTLAGEVGAQTIAFGGVTVNVPVYYTASLDGSVVTLALNENAKPRIADEDATQAFELTADGVKIHLTNVHPKLHYALETCAKLGGAWTTGVFGQGRENFTATYTGASGFYRIAVRDAAESFGNREL